MTKSIKSRKFSKNNVLFDKETFNYLIVIECRTISTSSILHNKEKIFFIVPPKEWINAIFKRSQNALSQDVVSIS